LRYKSVENQDVLNRES